MLKKYFYFPVFIILWQALPAFPQPGVAVKDLVIKEKDAFIRMLPALSNDSAIIYPLARFFDNEVERTYSSIRNAKKVSSLEKEKATRSLVFFIKELGRHVKQSNVLLYDIPATFSAYTSILNALLYNKPVPPVLQRAGVLRTQLVAASFSQYKEHELLEDIAVYKRVAASPEYILRFLENKPAFRFADSLLLTAAAHDPSKIIYYLNRMTPGIQNRIRNNPNLYLKQIVALSSDKNAHELLPFLTLLAEGKITTGEIVTRRMEVIQYYQLLVNTVLQSAGENIGAFQQPLRKGLRQKTQAFYVNPVNDLHDAPDATRFTSVKDLRPQDLYYIITSSGEELYTSSYLGLYRRLMDHYKGGYADSLFDIVQFDNLQIFIRLAATYNVLEDLLKRLSPERKSELLKKFIERIESDETTALERAMDIADSFKGIIADSTTSELVKAELNRNLRRCVNEKKYLGVRLYGILSDMFKMLGEKDGLKRLWVTLGDYEILKQKTLKQYGDSIIQLVLFYGDEDGVASFSNFLRLFTDKTKWAIDRNQNWVTIRSLTAQPMSIYANRPLDIRQELDLRAQDTLMAFLKENSLSPSILVHRGHSYHLEKTLNRLAPSVKLAILGSCGSYNRSISIATINPDIQVIGSKKTGSKSINDPIIDEINGNLLAGKDLYWPEIWKRLNQRFAKDPATMTLFNEYFPPSDNLGLFVLKLFNYYRRSF